MKRRRENQGRIVNHVWKEDTNKPKIQNKLILGKQPIKTFL